MTDTARPILLTMPNRQQQQRHRCRQAFGIRQFRKARGIARPLHGRAHVQHEHGAGVRELAGRGTDRDRLAGEKLAQQLIQVAGIGVTAHGSRHLGRAVVGVVAKKGGVGGFHGPRVCPASECSTK